jgi:hypothetical protein
VVAPPFGTAPEVITRLPAPVIPTATNRPLAYVTLSHRLSAADVRLVHVIPSGLVITRSPAPDCATANAGHRRKCGHTAG